MQIRLNIDRESNIPLLRSLISILNEQLEEGCKERKEFYESFNLLAQSETEEFYREKAKGWHTDDCASYFSMIDQFSQAEEEVLLKVSEGIDNMKQIAAFLRRSFYDILICDYKQQLVTSQFGFGYMISQKYYGVMPSNQGPADGEAHLHIVQRRLRADLRLLQGPVDSAASIAVGRIQPPYRGGEGRASSEEAENRIRVFIRGRSSCRPSSSCIRSRTEYVRSVSTTTSTSSSYSTRPSKTGSTGRHR